MRWFWVLAGLWIATALLVGACASSGDDDDNDSSSNDDGNEMDDDTGSPWEWTDPDAECESMLETEGYQACRDCVIQCNLAAENKKDLSDGPCLSEQIVEGWACDIIHSPAIPEDDLKDNQCAQYPTIVPHLVQVTPFCRFVQAF